MIDAVGPKLGDARDGRPPDHYGALVRAIVGQQLSTKAARSIFLRLTERFDGRTPTPEQVLADEPEELRAAAGLSRAKVSYLRSLAEHALSGELELERLDELPDEQVISELVAVKGIGVWSAHMFLMFHLQRPDVLPVGDLGIRHAIERAYALDEIPDAATMERDRRTVAPAPHAGLPLPLALARQRADVAPAGSALGGRRSGRRRHDRADVPVRRLVQVDDHRGVIAGSLALARLAVDPRRADSASHRRRGQHQIDAHPEVAVEHPGAVVPVGEHALGRPVLAHHVAQAQPRLQLGKRRALRGRDVRLADVGLGIEHVDVGRRDVHVATHHRALRGGGVVRGASPSIARNAVSHASL